MSVEIPTLDSIVLDDSQENKLIDARKTQKSFKAPELKEAAFEFVCGKLEELTAKSKALAEKFLPTSMSEVFKEIEMNSSGKGKQEVENVDSGEEQSLEEQK